MILSMIASATVWSAIASYHAPMGICDAMMVDIFATTNFKAIHNKDYSVVKTLGCLVLRYGASFFILIE